MEYIITRTSNGRDFENPKVEGVTLKEIPVTEIDIRTFSSFEEFRKNLPTLYEQWRKVGFDFKEEGDHISKKYMSLKKVWVKDFSTLEELNDFIDEVGSVVISYPQWVEKQPIIEIYDDYRE